MQRMESEAQKKEIEKENVGLGDAQLSKLE